jgi:hypothetical protein
MNHIQNMDPLENVRENIINYPESQFQAQKASINLLIKSGLLGHFWRRILLKNIMCLPNKSRQNMGWVSTHITEITEMPCTTDNSQNNKTASTLLYEVNVVHAFQPHDLANRINFNKCFLVISSSQCD